jgi:hypothetical protein
MVAAMATDASAQEVPRAFRGLFKASDTPANSRHRVDWSASFNGSYAQAELDLAPVTDAFDLPLYEATGVGMTHVIQYAFVGDRRVFGNVAGGSFGRYGSFNWLGTRYFNHMRFATPTGPRTNVALRALVTHTPFYSFDLTIDPEHEDTELLLPDATQPMAVRSTTYFDVSAQWRYRASLRSEISVSGDVAYTNYSGAGIDSITPSGTFRYSRQMTEHARLQLGYGVRQWEYPGVTTPVVRTHNIISGVSYSRPLPFSRRTQFGFDIGSAAAQTPNAWRYDVNGGAFVLHPLGRAWLAVGSYRRGLDFRAGLSEPLYLFGDSAAFTISGVVARRFVIRGTSTFVTGMSLFDQLREHNRWWSTSGSFSTLVFGIATYVQAGWTGQRFAAQVGHVTGLPTNVDRFFVSAGLSVGLPLVR